MPTFDTPEPISAAIDLVAGDVRLTATDAGATVVTVRPSDASDDDDRKAAAATLVECAGGRLVVRAPRPGLRSWLSPRGVGSIDVTIELPAGSDVHGTGHTASFHCDGRLADCRIKTGLGSIRLAEAASVSLKSGAGDISADRVTGHAAVMSASGDVRVRELGENAVVKTANGDTWVGSAGGDVALTAANGTIAVDVAHAGVVAKSAKGDLRLGEVVRGSVVLQTHTGDVEVGIREGTAAWLDVSALAGQVHNALAAAAAPEPSAETVEVRARTSTGDVVIRRA